MENSPSKWYRHLVFKEYATSARNMGLYRIAFVFFYLLLFGVPTVTWLSQVPEFLFYPQIFSVARFYALYIPSDFWLGLIDFSIITAFTCLLFGVRTRFTSVALTVLLVLAFSLKFSTGKIGHAIFLAITPLFMAFSDWGEAFSVTGSTKTKDNKKMPREMNAAEDTKAQRKAKAERESRATDRKSSNDTSLYNGFALFLLAFSFGFAMFTAGWLKILGGWLSPDQFGSFYHFGTRYFFREENTGLFTDILASNRNILIWKAMDYVTIAFECLFLFAVLNKRIFQWFCAFGILFHIATMLIFDIAYVNNLLVYLAFIPWNKVSAFLKSKKVLLPLERLLSIRNFWMVLAGLILCHFLFLFVLDGHLVRDKLISPFISTLSWLSSNMDFRDWRILFLLPLSALVLIWPLFLQHDDASKKLEQ
ncbi:MAG: hypothetical protein WA913_06135 [Pricia sp.]